MPPNDDAPSLRDTIESAMNAGAEPVPDTAAEAPVVETAPAAEPAPSVPETDAPPPGERARGEDGKFAKGKPTPEKPAPKPGTEKAAPPAAVKGTPAGAAPSPAPAGEPAIHPAAAPQPVKAPSSWKPAVRELAAKLPAEFRPILEESIRVDNEAKRALNDSAQARQMASQVRETLAPFEGLARANGMDPLRYAGSVMQTAATLHMGTPAQKAAVVAQLIGSYGIDVDAVNQYMQGQPVPQGAQAPQPPQDVGQLVERAIQERLSKATETRAAKAWQDFQATEPEFLEAVQPMMRAILMSAGEEGRNMTYAEAYEVACRATPEVSSVLDQRKAAEAVRAQAPAVQRAKVAGSSIKAAPSAAPGTRPEGSGRRSLRDDLEAAIAGQRT